MTERNSLGRLEESSKKVIYLLECDKDYCKQQYIGMTNDFREGIYQHVGYVRNNIKARATGAHFNLPGHGIRDMKFTILEQVRSINTLYAREQEKSLIRKFNTFHCGITCNVCQLLVKKNGFWVFLVQPSVVSVLLSASVERCFSPLCGIFTLSHIT